MSDTPRTDAELFFADVAVGRTESVVHADFARQLERELAAAQAVIAQMREARPAGLREAARLVRMWLQDPDVARMTETARDACRKVNFWPEWLENTAKDEAIVSTTNALTMNPPSALEAERKQAKREALEDAAGEFEYYTTIDFDGPAVAGYLRHMIAELDKGQEPGVAPGSAVDCSEETWKTESK